MNKIKKIISSVIIFFMSLFIATTVNANQIEDWISAGWSNGAPIAGTFWFTNEAVAASLNQKSDFFDASPLYVCGAEVTYQTPICTHPGTSTYGGYCNIYSLHAAYCIDNGNYSGSGANNRFLINNIVDLLPDGTVQVYSLSDTQWNTFGPGAYTTQMKQLAYLANRANVTDEWHVSSNSYKAALGSMIGYYRSTLINMGVDGSLSIKSNYGGSSSSARAQEAIRESANKNYRARFMFLVRNGNKGLGYGQSIVLFAAREEQALGEIEIVKTDSRTGKELANVGITIKMTSGEKAGQYVTTDGSGKAVYTPQETILKTGSDGRIHISNMVTGNYEIVEKINPNFGYDTSDLPKVVKTGTISAGASEKVNITNERKYIKISGYVWEDMIAEKTSVRNWLWRNDTNDTADRRVMNVEVTLKKADGTVIDTRTTGTIMDSNNQEVQGAYIFGDYMRDPNAKKIQIGDLEGAYIEFKYNGMCYKSVQVNTNLDNGSKATDDNLRSSFNENYATVVNGEAQNGNGQRTYGLTYDYDQEQHISTLNYGGEYLYGYYEDSSGGRQKYPISGINEQYMITANTKDAAPNNLLGQRISINDILTQGLEEIPNINLGLWEREMPDMVAVEDLDKVEISLNGYTHTYEYAQRMSAFEETMNDKNFNVTVSYQNERGSSYTREFYPSDVVYNKENPQSLSVYITYKIGLKNEANTINTRVNEIMNYYDSRYTIDKIEDQEGNKITEIKEDQTYSETTQEGNTYKRSRIVVNQDIKNQNATPENESSGFVNLKYLYIRYKLNNDAINSLLNGEATLNSAVEITSYSSFDDEKFTNRYAGVDRDSQPGNMEKVEDTTYHEDDTNKAGSLILKVKESRVIKGTVWEEDVIETELNKIGYDRQRKGNGLYDIGENVVEKVKVELLKVGVDGSGKTVYELADLYKYDNTTGVDKLEKAETYTDNKGNYEFSGVIPSNYVIRYTYGKDSVIYDSNGNSLGKVETEQYKSTIYRNGEEPNGNYWYREETGESSTRLSDAKDEIGIKQNGDRVDIVDERTSTEDKIITYEIAKEEQEDKKLEYIEANTNIFDIRLDYDIKFDNISKYGTELKFIFDNIDLGIIRRPIQNLDIRKEISFVEVTLANGQTVISGDPREGNVKYLKIMPDGNVHIELDDELIQGATLKIEYEITVDNTKAEIDYNDKNYYYYGAIPEENTGWKLATVTKLFDYLSNDLSVDLTGSDDWIDIKSEIKSDMVDNGLLSQEAYNTIKTYNTVLETQAFANMEPGQTKSITLKATKLLANDKELSFENDVEVNTLKESKMEYEDINLTQSKKDKYVYATPGNYKPGTGFEVESDDDSVILVVTGPTGENKNYITYIALGISSFIILGTGIIFIKKKVL